MTPHTCQEKPNSEGRTSSNCDGCYSTAYGDGNHAGGKQAVETMQKRMEQTVLENMNPLNEGEEKAATLRWHEGRRILDLIRNTAESVQKDLAKGLSEHIKNTTEKNPEGRAK